MKVPILQHLLSYLLPIKLLSAEGKTTPRIHLYRFRGRWQLGAATALYSDGAAYRPLLAAFRYLQGDLKQKKDMLVLGAGLGSAVSVLHKLHISMKSTLIDIDPQIIEWGKQIIEEETGYACQWICSDVQDFVTEQQNAYELIVLDVFQDRVVPHFVTTVVFLQKCNNLLKDTNSALVLNYIINNPKNWTETLSNIQSIFRIEHTIQIGINRILVLRKNA
ncbi:MAG: hypothetical protein QM530_03260 [Phycisphaerales bacterium]|nr:hypothetical protein [Phycisphaerales bacterium]